MTTKARSGSDSLLTPLHPALEGKTYTLRQVRDIAIMSGLPPQVVAGFLTGRMRPDRVIADQLLNVIGEQIVNSIIDNYDPFRDMTFVSEPPKDQKVINKYPVRCLRDGDFIFMTDSRWVKVSKVVVGGQKVKIFSGNTVCTSTSVRNHVIASVSPESRKNAQESESNKRWREAIRDKVSSMDTDEEGIHRMDMIEDMLSRARNSSDT